MASSPSRSGTIVHGFCRRVRRRRFRIAWLDEVVAGVVVAFGDRTGLSLRLPLWRNAAPKTGLLTSNVRGGLIAVLERRGKILNDERLQRLADVRLQAAPLAPSTEAVVG